jgi:hypothetical protein
MVAIAPPWVKDWSKRVGDWRNGQAVQTESQGLRRSWLKMGSWSSVMRTTRGLVPGWLGRPKGCRERRMKEKFEEERTRERSSYGDVKGGGPLRQPCPERADRLNRRLLRAILASHRGVIKLRQQIQRRGKDNICLCAKCQGRTAKLGNYLCAGGRVIRRKY